ncbi:aminoglycoside phosphotransferase family protein [Ciceribacter sp. L1K22]|uniref:aminoglycoside phosphotransferase family protein n=1 Tax=Ciceribacter sp. L1K22 TaxID=2820275 RepID=UPI001ABE531C|nr:aminoglycoside phosphotransferase family protein [Ciceribacter sp. L1K22]MBO3759797.1 streptomycin resistance protein [Ciceribacter sp. L1K22]
MADLSTFPPKWEIEEAKQIAETAAGTVFEVKRAGDRLDIVKVFRKKSLIESQHGVDFLEWRGGVGAILVLGRTDDAVLLEHAGSQTLRSVMFASSDTDATHIAAELVEIYHSTSDALLPISLQPAVRYFDSLFKRAARDKTAEGYSLFVEAAELVEMLLGEQKDLKPLHGDLHHENILRGGRGWLVIDPAGLIGDPALDVANMFSNPLDRQDLTRDETRIASMADIFSTTLRRDARTILRYAFAYACLSAAWYEEDGHGRERDDELAVAAAIRNVMRQS